MITIRICNIGIFLFVSISKPGELDLLKCGDALTPASVAATVETPIPGNFAGYGTYAKAIIMSKPIQQKANSYSPKTSGQNEKSVYGAPARSKYEQKPGVQPATADITIPAIPAVPGKPLAAHIPVRTAVHIPLSVAKNKEQQKS